jgi:transcription antitermination factor NusB
MQALCQAEVVGEDLLAHLDEFLSDPLIDDQSPPAVQQDYARDLVRGVWEALAAIDGRIAASCEHWEVRRLSAVDRNILRVAVRELTDPDALVPPRVVIDEAIEIARVFGTAQSPAFVNGVLDAIRKKLDAAVPATGGAAAPPPARATEA